MNKFRIRYKLFNLKKNKIDYEIFNKTFKNNKMINNNILNIQ